MLLSCKDLLTWGFLVSEMSIKTRWRSHPERDSSVSPLVPHHNISVSIFPITQTVTRWQFHFLMCFVYRDLDHKLILLPVPITYLYGRSSRYDGNLKSGKLNSGETKWYAWCIKLVIDTVKKSLVPALMAFHNSKLLFY